MITASFLALPALLRLSFLAAASQTTFSVQDDLLAFPQYDIKFSDDYVLDPDARDVLHISSQHDQEAAKHAAPPSQIEHYRPAGKPPNTDSNDEDAQAPLEYEYMYLDGQPYLCAIPQVTKRSEAEAANDTLTQVEEERELARANERGWELLSGMQGSCVYFISGWWSYKFCYNDGVRQFHQLPPSRGVPVYPPVEDPSVEGYTLGQYSEAPPPAETGTDVGAASSKVPVTGELVQRGESRYLLQRLSGGTKCDLTGRERKVEVQFHCNTSPPTDRISLIKETSTCAYLMVIQTPRLCNDVAFLPPQKDSPNSITCTPILDETQVDDYKRDIVALREVEKEAKIWDAQPDAAKVFLGGDVQLVGDTIVGGHNIVPEDLKLEKSAIVGGGKETYVDTVASSDGKFLSKEDIEKLGLGDVKSVEKLRKKLEEIAKGQEWKLDVIDTPRGREYRGIIGDDKAEEKMGEGGKEDEAKEKETEQEGSKEEYYKEEL